MITRLAAHPRLPHFPVWTWKQSETSASSSLRPVHTQTHSFDHTGKQSEPRCPAENGLLAFLEVQWHCFNEDKQQGIHHLHHQPTTEGSDSFVIGVPKTSKETVIAKMITSVRLKDEMLQMRHQMHLMYVTCDVTF